MSFKIVKAAEEGRVCIITSKELIDELNRALTYPRLKRICKDAGVSKEQLISAVLYVAQLVEANSKLQVVLEDLADNKIIECALDGKADYVVSGDNHLLKIGGYKKMRIVSVRPMLEIINREC